MSGWTWVNDLLGSVDKKKAHNWDLRCPYFWCPSNELKDGVIREKPPRLKFIEKVSPMIYKYRCRDCGQHTMFDVSVPNEQGFGAYDPRLWGGDAKRGIVSRRIF